MDFIKRLKEKWKIPSTLDILLICLVFSLAGMSIGFSRKFIMNLLGLDFSIHPYLYVSVYILLIFPMYQTFLIIYGFIFGQFSFFWEKEKKMAKWFVRLFQGTSKNSIFLFSSLFISL